MLQEAYLQQQQPEANHTTLRQIQSDGVIRIGLVQASNSYLPHIEERPGVDFELSHAFAEFLGVESKHIAVSDKELQRFLSGGKIHIAATPLRAPLNAEMQLASSYDESSLLLVKQRNMRGAATLDTIHQKDWVMIKDGRESQWLENNFNLEHRKNWQSVDLANRDRILQFLNKGEYKYTVVPSKQFYRAQFYYPEISLVQELDKPRSVAWAIQSPVDELLDQKLQEFFLQMKKDGVLERLMDKYYGHTAELKYWDTRVFSQRINERLPLLRKDFIDAARITPFDWKLLAAVGYQESHWKEDAKSYTGVRGIMMLTEDTARQMGVKDRTNSRESILGGARYLQHMIEKIPERIAMPDRLWMALAAYNIGFGHLEDARKLTQTQGGNADRWKDVKQFLLLLADEQWHQQTRLGFARGYEAVDYVKNIRRYYDILLWKVSQEKNRRDTEDPGYINLFDSKVL